MLVLTRKSQEAVVVGGSVGFESLLTVTVLEITSGKVRLGFDIDDGVPVHRLEVWERIQAGDGPVNPGKALPLLPTRDDVASGVQGHLPGGRGQDLGGQGQGNGEGP